MPALSSPLRAALVRMDLLRTDEPAQATALTGGVSSDIWRIDRAAGPICAKRALARLRVAADWQAPVERNIYEARWMRHAYRIRPDCCPQLLGQDRQTGTIAMEYLPPENHPVWKSQLHAGYADPDFAAAVGATLVAIHAGTAADPAIAAEFPTAEIFCAIRLDPYLLATARAHPDRADALQALVATTEANRRSLVHGDVSPKNILAGPHGPVLLDAECATWGDPAFDLAFCLNHLLLKCLWTPPATDRFLACFDALSAAYLAGITWEDPATLESRAAHLLPGLCLARVDGKSPVEYITAEQDKNRVRECARSLLAGPVERLAAVRRAWGASLADALNSWRDASWSDQ